MKIQFVGEILLIKDYFDKYLAKCQRKQTLVWDFVWKFATKRPQHFHYFPSICKNRHERRKMSKNRNDFIFHSNIIFFLFSACYFHENISFFLFLVWMMQFYLDSTGLFLRGYLIIEFILILSQIAYYDNTKIEKKKYIDYDNFDNRWHWHFF